MKLLSLLLLLVVISCSPKPFVGTFTDGCTNPTMFTFRPNGQLRTVWYGSPGDPVRKPGRWTQQGDTLSLYPWGTHGGVIYYRLLYRGDSLHYISFMEMDSTSLKRLDWSNLDTACYGYYKRIKY